jgi:hypothetical protein
LIEGNGLKLPNISIARLIRGLVMLMSGIGLSLIGMNVYCQADTQFDSTNVQLPYNKSNSTAIGNDTIHDTKNDAAAMDIGSSRGIFILSADGMIQLRILGSIRTNINYTDQDMTDRQTFNPYEIPTNVNTNSPNFFAGLQQTRLGIEVIRRTKNMGDLFIRFEGDFKNSSTSLRIRHAYGQLGRLLIGQTWSLMNNVSYQPALVSLDGPVSGSGLRTPQVRYSHEINQGMAWNAAIEYSAPEIQVPDSLGVTALQVIPSFTARFSNYTHLIKYRFAAVITTISGRIESEQISYSFGYGGSFAGKMKIKSEGEFFLQITTGKAIAHFMDTFNGKDVDVVYNPNTGKFEALYSTGGYIAYEHKLPKEFSTSLALGITAITNKDFQSDHSFSHSYNALLNLFWQPTEGARLGIEFANGQRFDKGGSRGRANRVSFLIYYDF